MYMQVVRYIVIWTALLAGMDACAASAYWSGINVFNSNTPNGLTMDYRIGGGIHGENGEYTWILTSIYGNTENGNLYLKQNDFSQESMDATFNWWAIVSYGEVVDEATFHDATKQVALFYGDAEYASIKGTLVENPRDFYMAFKASEVLDDGNAYVEGQSWYGWVHVSVADDLTMTLLGSGIDLYGGAVTVGAVPEPGGGLLLLIGGAMLALRRRR